MLGRTYEDQVCSIARSLEVLGERWTLLVVRDALLGLRRFDDFQRSLRIARNILTDRLARLVTAGVLERIPYQERPVRHEYQLTPMGYELAVPIIGLMHWGDRHFATPAGPPAHPAQHLRRKAPRGTGMRGVPRADQPRGARCAPRAVACPARLIAAFPAEYQVESVPTKLPATEAMFGGYWPLFATFAACKISRTATE